MWCRWGEPQEASQQQLVTMYAEAEMHQALSHFPTQARCRCLASMLAQLRRAQLRGAWVTLAQQRWEQRFAREAGDGWFSLHLSGF